MGVWGVFSGSYLNIYFRDIDLCCVSCPDPFVVISRGREMYVCAYKVYVPKQGVCVCVCLSVGCMVACVCV